MNLTYLTIRILTFPLSLLPLPVIHFMGKGMGILAYHVMTKYRKRALSNLSLANLEGIDLKKTAIESFQNLAITCLEYPKFGHLKKTSHILSCDNPEEAQSIIDSGRGIIFYCGHQANWELLFLEGTQRMPGVAIGRPIKNRTLYQWILDIREKFGGKIIEPKEGLKEGLRALKQGKFLGIVGDQGMPESPYAFDFFGRRAWTTPLPAILAYRTGCPIMVATIRREKGKYITHYSAPIWPQKENTLDKEIVRMMKISLELLEADIRLRPGQWLWQHNRWKQETPINLYYRYRWDSILVILPKDFPLDQTFREIYPQAFITFFVPEGTTVPFTDVEVLTYKEPKELFITDYRFKLVFNFSGIDALGPHFLKQSAFEVVDMKKLEKAAAEHLKPGDPFPLLLKKALTRPNTLWKKDAS